MKRDGKNDSEFPLATPAERCSLSWFANGLILLGIAGIILSYLSLRSHYLAQHLPEYQSFCNVNAEINCDKVNASEYSTFLGVPLGAYGCIFYLVLLLLGIAAHFTRNLRIKNVTLVLGFLSVLLSIYLFYISKYVVGALCLLCMGMYLINFFLLLISLPGDGIGILKRYGDGLAAIIDLPRAIFGVGKYRKQAESTHAFIGFLAVIGGIFVILSLPKFFVGKSVTISSDSAREIDKEVARWKMTLPVEIPIDASKDYTKGTEGAPIQMVEFFDFECPACRMAHPVLEEIFQQYQGKVQITYKNYPLDKSCNPLMVGELHHHACFAASFSLCAGEQGKYWETAHALLTHPVLEDHETGPAEVQSELMKTAESLGIDAAKLEQCMQSQRIEDRIQEEILQGGHIKLSGTPSLFINGRKVSSITRPLLQAILKDAAR